MQNSNRSRIVTIPNILTTIRILLIPVVVMLFFRSRTRVDYIITGAVLTFSCITDMFDGLIARKFNMVTTLGQVLDPIADKGTQFSMLICLSSKWPFLWIILPFFIIKECFQIVCALVYFRRGKMLKGALLPGKICTTVIFISMVSIIVFPDIPPALVVCMSILCCILLVISFITYFKAYFGKEKELDDRRPRSGQQDRQ